MGLTLPRIYPGECQFCLLSNGDTYKKISETHAHGYPCGPVLPFEDHEAVMEMDIKIFEPEGKNVWDDESSDLSD